jgi:hypothetical protein
MKPLFPYQFPPRSMEIGEIVIEIPKFLGNPHLCAKAILISRVSLYEQVGSVTIFGSMSFQDANQDCQQNSFNRYGQGVLADTIGIVIQLAWLCRKTCSSGHVPMMSILHMSG